VVRLDVGAPSLRHRLVRPALVWGDVVMMRKQLLTLARLAARDADGGQACADDSGR
jgi:hypothetical protein